MLEKLKKLNINTDKLKAIFNLVFYALLIGILIFAIKSKNSAKTPEKKPDEKAEVIMSGFEKLKKKNFEYVYTLSKDEDLYVYIGKKYSNRDLVELTHKGQSQDLFLIDELTFMKLNKKWELINEKPYLYFDFFDIDLIEKIVANSTYNADESVYEIKTSVFVSLVDYITEVKEDGINKFSLKYENKDIVGLSMNISDLAKLYDNNLNSVKLELKYSEVSKVKDLTIHDES